MHVIFSFFLLLPLFIFGWMDQAVEEEFKTFEENGITKEGLDSTWDLLKSDSGFQRYQVVGSQVYGPSGPIRNLLERLLTLYPVPDVDFIYCSGLLRDWYLFNRKLNDSVPILVGAKHSTFDRAILFFDSQCDIEKDFNSDLIQQIDKANQEMWPWPMKIEKLFWRGPATDACYCMHNWTQVPRGRITYYSKHKFPDLIDAAITGGGIYTDWRMNQAYREAPLIPTVDHLQYKYQLLIDAGAPSFTDAFWRLFSGCLVMKHDSGDVQWFSKGLTPWKHYVPLKYDLSDVVEKILWARQHDDEARQIAKNAREFAESNLTREHTLLYCYKVLAHYASLQKFQPAP